MASPNRTAGYLPVDTFATLLSTRRTLQPTGSGRRDPVRGPHDHHDTDPFRRSALEVLGFWHRFRYLYRGGRLEPQFMVCCDRCG